MKNFTNRLMLCLVAVLAFSFMNVQVVQAQDSRTTTIGNVSYSTNSALTADDMQFPRGKNATATDVMHTYGVTVGVRRSWQTPDGQSVNFQVAQVMQSKFNDFETVVVPVDFKRTFRTPFPDKVIDGTNWTQTFDQDDPVDPSIPSDAMLYNKMDLWPAHGMGMQLERYTYLFSNDEAEEIVVHEYVITNTSGENRDDVYIGLNGGINAHGHYTGDLFGNYVGVTYPDYVAGNVAADPMRLWYAWNPDQTTSSPNEDDKGAPDASWGNFNEAQFIGRVILHADASASDESDDPMQPVKAGWSQRDFVANLNEADQPTTYNYLSQNWNTGPNNYAMFVDREGNEATAGMYRIMQRSGGAYPPHGIDFSVLDPELEQEKNNLMSFGPYQLAAGEDVRIVTALVNATLPSRLLIDAGRAYNGGQEARNTFGVNPLPNNGSYTDMHGRMIVENGNVLNPATGEMIAAAGTTLDKATKDAILDLGQEMVFTTALKAISMWTNGNVREGTGSFDIELGPAAPSVEYFSENDQTRLSWSPVSDAASYNIYREYKRSPSITSPTDSTFLLLANVSAAETGYTDNSVVRGEDYYYIVSAVGNNGVESSLFQNRSGTAATKQDEAVSPTRTPDASWQENVVVVPNPFHTQAAEKYEGDRLNFLNLPAFANIHIFTMTGDLVQSIKHNSSTGDQDWEEQDTFSTTEIVSGVYIYVVEELSGADGSPTGESATGKFVVIK